ncbi:MAG: multidrug efflux pump [Planctomycetota bacterium]|jgi:multidrug efflux pump
MRDLFYRRPRILVLFLMLVVVSGLGALRVLPRAEDPELTARNSAIFAAFPGASALRVEALITGPIEDELAELEEIGELVSSSRAGLAVLQIELLDEVDNVDQVWSRVRDKLADVQANLPDGALAPELVEFEIAAFTLIFGLVWDMDEPAPMGILSRHGEDLADHMRALGGTQQAELFGEVDEQVQVLVDPARLASYQLTVRDVAEATRAADSKIPAGSLVGDRERLLLEIDGELDSIDRIANLPVRVSPSGHVVRVGDIGEVQKQPRTPIESEALIYGRRGVAVGVRMESGRRVDHWSASALEAFEEFQASLPRGVRSEIIFEQSSYTERRLSNLFQNFAMGAGFVVLVILLMMGWRSALLVGLALPLSTLMVLQGMRMLGIPINQMSVAGLIIALGLLIDNAIVMVDEVRHKLMQGHSRGDAVREAVGDLAVPLLGSTATTVFAFLPIVLMPGGAGEFVGSMAMSVILAIVSSLFLALTVTAALAGRFEKVAPSNTRRGLLVEGFSSPAMTRLYTKVMGMLMARPVLPIMLAAVLPLLGLWKSSELPDQFFPPADRDQFVVELFLPQQATLQETKLAAQRAREVMLAHERVQEVHWFIGESGPKFYYNLIDNERNASYYARSIVQLDGPHESLTVVRELQSALDGALPGVTVLAKQIEQGPPFEAPVELYVFGSDLDQLRQIGDELRGHLASLPLVTHTRALLKSGRPKLRLGIDEEGARLAGWNNTSIARELFDSLEGVSGGSILEATEELPVVVRLADAQRTDITTIASLELTRGTTRTPLSALGDFHLEPEIASIPHREGMRGNTIQAFIQAGTLPADTLAAAVARLEKSNFELPPGYHLEIGGESAERDRALGNLASTAAVLLVAMAASLVLAFSSFRLAAVVATIGVLAVGLSMGSLWLFGYNFGFMAIVGTMGLIGVAINDSIVVLAALEADAEARAGSKEAVVAVVVRSTRHVLATTFTTTAGFLPLWVAGGGFWPPVAVSIGCGVLGATLLALTFVPAAFLLVRAKRSA